MSHSKVFDEYVKILSERGLLKTADKKDINYNVVPDKAGPGMEVDTTGYELTEIAHPEQIQIAESQLQDGIVENGVERQKTMVDIALRNPRGVLATLMQTLTKAATVLDAEMSDESIRMASEIDAFIEKIAQQAPEQVQNVGSGSTGGWTGTAGGVAGAAAFGGAVAFLASNPVGWGVALAGGVYAAIDRIQKSVGDIYEAFEVTGKFLNKLDFGWWGARTTSQKTMEAKINQIGDKLQEFGAIPSRFDDEKQTKEILKATVDAIQYINSKHAYVTRALSMTSDIGVDASNAKDMWDKMARMVNKWLDEMNNELIKNKLVQDPSLTPAPTASPEQKQPVPVSAVTKAPSAAHHYSVMTPEVSDLQRLLGFNEPDSKFGPLTFGALQQAASKNSLLNDLLKSKPELAQGYQNWKNSDVGTAIQRIQQGKESVQVAQAPKNKILDPYA